MNGRPLFTVAVGLLASATAPAESVRFVGCSVNGQQGRQPPPPARPTPDVPEPAGRKLAYYATADAGVLAPRYWFCSATAGSNGTTIVVARHPIGWRTAVLSAPIKGAVVVLRQTSGSTSGRFAVAEIAARVFPAARTFVSRVEGEGLTGRAFPRGPFVADRLTYRGPHQVLYTTTALRNGLGTRAPMVPGPLPVDGVEWLHAEDADMDLTSLAIRLSKHDRPLAAEIIRQAAPPPKP